MDREEYFQILNPHKFTIGLKREKKKKKDLFRQRHFYFNNTKCFLAWRFE